MKLWMSGEIQLDVDDAYVKARNAIQKEVNQLLAGVHLDEQAYGWDFIAIILSDDRAANYPEVVKRSSRGKSLEFRLRIPHDEFLSASQGRRIDLVFAALSRSVERMKELGVPATTQSALREVLSAQGRRSPGRFPNSDRSEERLVGEVSKSGRVGPPKTEYWGNNYGYDAWGNLLQKTPTKCSAENLSVTALVNNQLSGYGYDGAGNMTHDSTTNNNYLFDVENRIVGAAGYTYTYDADGNRVEKSNGSTGTIYWYMSPGIVAESDLSGNLQSEYVFFDGERIARKDFPSSAVSYYFSDHLKTASVITDSAGNIKEDEDYYPWGGELQLVNDDSNHYKFTGKERDAETGLDYFGARYYGNWTGRFMSADWAAKPEAVPYSDLGDPQSLNLYSYVRNIPTSQTDLDGHCPECEELVEKVVIRLVLEHPKTAAAVAAVAEKTGETVVKGAEVAEEGAVSALGVVLGVFTLSQKTAGPDKDELHPKPAQIEPQLGQGRGADEEKSQSDIANERIRTNGGIVNHVDFSNDLKQDLEPGQKNSVDIQYTGSRAGDFAAANEAAGFKSTPKGYTWHHVPNYNAKTNTGTMQLVNTQKHGKYHHGGVRQYEKAHKKKYRSMIFEEKLGHEKGSYAC